MSLYVDKLSALLFKSEDGRELVNQLNLTLKSLIYNDTRLIDATSIAPQIWECKWINDYSIKGYQKGFAVWMNTNLYQDIFSEKYSHIIDVIQNNSILSPMLAALKTPEQRNEFILKAIRGEASLDVPAIYVLGDTNDHVQIRISKVDNNKAYPTDDNFWEDFYIRSTFEDNVSTMLSILGDEIDSQYSQHLNEYHINGITAIDLSSNGFFQRKPFIVDNIKQQYFFDHTYCSTLDGFDYVTSWMTNDRNTQWCRVWKSGYVEQGGFAFNTSGNDFIDVSFMKEYNYPSGTSFYQQGYSYYGNSSQKVNCTLTGSKRYIVTVTPILKNNANSAYPNEGQNIQNEIVYSSIDVTNIKNTGFSIVNVDKNASLYEKYSWHTAGYCIPL